MKKKILWLLLIILLGCLLSFSFLVICHHNFDFSLKGEKLYNINLEEEFKDPGFNCDVLDYDLGEEVNISNNLDVNQVGEYEISYEIDFLGINYEISRKIKVIDNVVPDISLNGEAKITLNAGTKYTELGAKAIDNYDGDLTDKISVSGEVDINTPGKYTVTYNVEDSSGNESSVAREVEVKKVIVNKNAYNNYILNKDVINDNDIIAFIKSNNYRVSIGYYNLVDGSTFYYNKDKVYYGASLIKTLDALYLYEKNMVTNDIKEHIKKTISVSNNESHKYLVNYIGKNNLKAYGVGLGATTTLVGGDYYGNTTINDQIIYMKKLYEITKDGNNNELKSFFINNYANFLKFNEINVMHKYGYYNHYFHESGIFLDSEPYILIVLTEHGGINHATVINNISKLIYKYHINN